MIFKTVLTTLFLTLCLGMNAQANESPKQAPIFALQPFERAICCIKYYEGIHRKKDYANYKIPKFYDFKSRDAKERKLYELFCQVNLDIKNMVDEINKFKVK